MNARGVRLLYGTMPLWRRLAVGVSDGADVEQLERNLVELGHDPERMTVDEEFDTDTAAAVESWQDALGVTETGAVEAGDAVFLPGPRRIGQLETSRRCAAAAGEAVLQVTATTPVVEIDLDARRQELARVGAKVRVELPSGRLVEARSPPSAKVAETSTGAQGEPGTRPSPSSIRLATGETRRARRRAGHRVARARAREGRARRARRGAPGAPRRRRGGRGGRDASGERTLTAVETGTFADGYVEIEGKRVAEGTRWWSPE